MTADRRARPDPFGRANAWPTPAPCMREVRHVHGDHDPRAWHWFARGPVVAADGGRRGDGSTERRGRNVEDEQLRDVAHVPADGLTANRVWERGEEADDEAAE